jgi:UDP-glucose 4-epimerase
LPTLKTELKNKAGIHLRILITGAAGFIGGHLALKAISAGYEVVLLDDYSSGSPCVIDALQKLANKVDFHEVDLKDTAHLRQVFQAYDQIDCVAHLAALKSAADSVHEPIEYYFDNCGASLSLFEVMKENHCQKIIFASTAAVYQHDLPPPHLENANVNPATPYGQSKLIVERVLQDACKASENFSATVFRFFNVTSADAKGRIPFVTSAEASKDLFSQCLKVLVGDKEHLTIYGDDFVTVDGTGVRDYIHVFDVCEAFLQAFKKNEKTRGYHCYNLGTQTPSSVKQVVSMFEQVFEQQIPTIIKKAREGELPVSYADSAQAQNVLDWHPQYDLKAQVQDLWQNHQKGKTKFY